MIFHAISLNSSQQLPEVVKIISGLVFTEEKTITLPKVTQLLMAELRREPMATGSKPLDKLGIFHGSNCLRDLITSPGLQVQCYHSSASHESSYWSKQSGDVVPAIV
jgi:hypothetical protein